MRSILLTIATAVIALQGLAQQWNRTYDMDLVSNVASSVQPLANGEFFSVKWLRSFTQHGLCAFQVDQFGDTLWTNCFRDSTKLYSTGASGSIALLSNGNYLFSGGTIDDSLSAQSLIVMYAPNGDTLWTFTMGGTGFENLNQVWEHPDGVYHGFGLQQDGVQSLFHLIVDDQGNFIDIHYYPQPGGANCMSGRRTQDGGYVLSGSNTPQTGNSQLLLIKTDSSGTLLWSKQFGSPWNDNVAFVEELPNGNLILAGSVRTQQAGFSLTGFLAELNSNGDTIWTKKSVGPYQNFFTRPVALSDGYSIAGSAISGPITVGMLHRTDLQGNELWRRTYQTNTVRDHYFYDVRPTLDGGFIMAGSAFDSLVTSQDAWLVKVDSFGCLVPGCQGVGIEEQVTDMGEVLRVWPNPVSNGEALQVEVLLPECKGCRLSVVSATGQLVEDVVISDLRFEISAPGNSGVYFMHLSDGTRWLAGKKVVVE